MVSEEENKVFLPQVPVLPGYDVYSPARVRMISLSLND